MLRRLLAFLNKAEKPTMLLAQITDLHIGLGEGPVAEIQKTRLIAALDALSRINPRPDLVIASGDLTDHGRVTEYRDLKEILDAYPFDVLPLMGNHDRREAFWEVFPDGPRNGDFVQYAIDDHPVRLVAVDTLDVGRHGGAFCAARAEWLDKTLSAEPKKPTIIAAHHPPITTGIPWMTLYDDSVWAERFAKIVSRHKQVKRVICGHIHRPIQAEWANTSVCVSPATSAQVALDFTPLDADTPDNRVLIVDEPPGICLHHWDGETLTSHVGLGAEYDVILRFDERMRKEMKEIVENRQSDDLP